MKTPVVLLLSLAILVLASNLSQSTEGAEDLVKVVSIVNLSSVSGAAGSAPAWSPDGKKIAYLRDGEGIYILTIEAFPSTVNIIPSTEEDTHTSTTETTGTFSFKAPIQEGPLYAIVALVATVVVAFILWRAIRKSSLVESSVRNASDTPTRINK